MKQEPIQGRPTLPGPTIDGHFMSPLLQDTTSCSGKETDGLQHTII